MPDTSVAASFQRIREKVFAGERLTHADGELLFQPEVDLHALGELANHVRERKNGNVAYYNINAHINPTNVCIYRCPLCAYSCDAGDTKAYVMSRDELLTRGQDAADAGATELHIVGGIHPEKRFDWYRGILHDLHQAFPQLHLKAWTAAEIAWLASLSDRSVEAVLTEMIQAGLGSLPGGGAEIFHPEVRLQVAPRKASAETWLAVHRSAHRLGLRSNATMLFGHVETASHRVDHLLRLRELQDDTGGFQAFIPLAFHPAGTQLDHLERPSGLMDLRVVAVSRLLLDNFDHIKAYWISLGVGTAQVALAYGADDLDGTVRQERIHHDAGATSPETLSVEQLCRLIRETGREPVQRDTLYHPIRKEDARQAVE